MEVQASLLFNSVVMVRWWCEKDSPHSLHLPYIIIISNDFPHAVMDDVEVSLATH